MTVTPEQQAEIDSYKSQLQEEQDKTVALREKLEHTNLVQLLPDPRCKGVALPIPNVP